MPGFLPRFTSVLRAGTLLAVMAGARNADAASAAYRVDTVDDAPDAVIDGICATARGDCTLRAALMEANLAGRDHKAVILLPAGDYTLTVPTGDAARPWVRSLEIARDVRIIGAGADVTRIHAVGEAVFHVTVEAKAVIRALTISDCVALTPSVIEPTRGAAVRNEGDLTLEECVFEGNANAPACLWDDYSAACSAGYGGAVFSSGTLTVDRCVFRSNGVGHGCQAISPNCAEGSGGAIFSSGTLDVRASLFEGNWAFTAGSHIQSGGSVAIESSTFTGGYTATFFGGHAQSVEASTLSAERPAVVTMTNVTISGGETAGLGLSDAPADLSNVTITRNQLTGIYSDASPITIRNSVVAHNDFDDVHCWQGSVLSNGYNIIQKVAADCSVTGALNQADPLLGPLRDNGGSPLALTAFPGNGSPAVNGGDPAGCLDSRGGLLLTDERGRRRPVGPRCDLGAVEADPKGDANADGVVSVSDVFFLLNFLFAGGPAPIGDADVDGSPGDTISDVFYLINYLFAFGPEPR